MIRETSLETYHTIINSKLSKKRKVIYAALFSIGSGTANEIFVNGKMQRYTESAHVQSRLLELKKMGLVMEIGTKTCSITGNRVINYTTTDSNTFKIYKHSRPSYAQRLKNYKEELYDLEKTAGDGFAAAAYKRAFELTESL